MNPAMFWKISCGVLGAGLLLAAGLSSPGGLEAALGRPAGILTWGPSLFRALLAFHGLAALYLAMQPRRPRPAENARPPFLLAEAASGRVWLLLALLTAIGLGLRLWRLDLSMWVDEVLTAAFFVRPPLGEIISSYPFQNQHLLYSLAAHATVAWFGESASSLRLPAVVLGVASIPALYLLGRRAVSLQVTLAAAALMTFSYHHIWFSQNARGYSGILFFAMVSTWFWLRALEDDRGWDWIGFVVATVAGLGIHMTMLFVTLSQMLIHAGMLAYDRPAAPRVRKPFFAYLLAGTLTLQLYALALPELLKSGTKEVSLPSEWTKPLWLLQAMVMNFGAGGLGLLVVAAGGAVALVGFLSIAKRNRAAALIFALPPVIGAVVVIASGHNLWPRFFFFAMGFGLLIVMEGVSVIVAQAATIAGRPRTASKLAALATTLVVVASAATVPRCYRYPKQDFTGARDWVEQNRSAGEPAVAVGTAGIVYKNYYAPQWTVIDDAAGLETLHGRSPSPWLVYTLPIEVRTYRPEIWRIIEKEYRPVRIFPGTLQGGGEIYVCRRIVPPAGPLPGGKTP